MSLNLNKTLAVTAIAAAGLVPTFNTTAHVPKGSWLERYEGAIMLLKKEGGGSSCCGGEDAQGELREETYIDDNRRTRYRVTLTQTLDGKPLPQPLKIEIPPAAVLTRSYAIEFCEKAKQSAQTDDAKKLAATCDIPTTNLLWTMIYSPEVSESGVTVYCYLPKASFTKNDKPDGGITTMMADAKQWLKSWVPL